MKKLRKKVKEPEELLKISQMVLFVDNEKEGQRRKENCKRLKEKSQRLLEESKILLQPSNNRWFENFKREPH